MTLLRRAEEGIQRQDWKLTIDSLQRIIDLEGEHVLTSDARVYESARRHAHRRIASLPRAGLAAYRLVHEGEAAALYSVAMAKYNPSLLRTVVDRYFCTRIGETAAVTLADWLIDLGQFSEAAALLRQVENLYPDPNLPMWVIPSRLAVCAAGLGQRQNAASMLEGLRAASNEAALRSGGAAGAAMPPERVDQLEGYVARAEPIGGSEGMDNWPVVYGRGSRDARMPEVEPAFLDYLPHIPLITSEPRQSRESIIDYARRHELPPVRQMVTHGRVLVVKGEGEILGLDADSFTQIWSSRRRHDQVRGEAQNPLQAHWQAHDSRARADADRELENDPLVRGLLYDSVSGSVGIAFNMVLTIDWPGEPPPLIPRSVPWQIRGGFPGRDPFSASRPNHVAAHDLQTGELLWRTSSEATLLDSERDPSEEAGAADIEFLAVPIAVNQVLLAPCRINTDLFAVLLDPHTGRILRRIYLCGTGGGPFDSLQSLDPAVADGVVFIPTGRGVLVALEAATWSIRWVVRYEGAPLDVQDVGWLPTPAIAVSDVILLAPGDSNFLYCLDRGSGRQRWRINRDSFSYLLGADDQHVWMAGRDVQLVEVETGRIAWRKRAGVPTGRGVLSGDTLFLPTAEGLVAMQSATGKRVELPHTGGEPPELGNLLAWDGSLYSVAPFHVSRFPDLNRGYDQAVARHAEDPADASRSIRLASLELLKNHPHRALVALEAVPDDLAEGEQHRHGRVVHLRVRAMLDVASSGQAEPAEALRLLREARSIAQSSADAIESSLALGDFLNSPAGGEQPVEACLQYLTLALSAEGDEMMTSPQGRSGLEQRARAIAVQRVVDASKGLSAEQREPIQRAVSEWLDDKAAQKDQAALQWLAESPGLGEQSCRAELILGGWAAEDLQIEQAETHLTRVLARESQASPELLAEAAARLALLYLEEDELHQPVAAAALLDRLETEWAYVELPAGLAGVTAVQESLADGRPALPHAAGPDGTGMNGESQPVTPSVDRVQAARFASAARQRIDPHVLARHSEALAPVHLGPLQAPEDFIRISDSSRFQPVARPLTIRGARSESLASLVLWLVERNKVQAHAADDGRLLWPAELRLLGDLAVEPSRDVLPQAQLIRSDPGEAARAVHDGQTLVVNSEYGIHAIGLLTGRRLWSRPFEPPPLPNRDASGRDWWIWCHNGYVVSVNGRGEVAVASVSQGERVLWQCTKPARRWHAVRARGEYVVAVDADLEQVDVFHLTDGRYVGECRFNQDPSPQRRVNVTLYDDVICGPASTREVVARELGAPGVERWRIELPASIAQIFKPSPDLLAVSDRNGLLQVIDPSNGRKLMEARVEKCGSGITGGALVEDVLYVYGHQNRVAENESEKQQFALAAIDMASGNILWQRGELASRTFLSEEILRSSSNAIPVASLVRAGREANAATTAVELMLLDKKTGREIGERIVFPLPGDTNVPQISDLQVWPGSVLVAVGPTQLRFPAHGQPAEGAQSAGAAVFRKLSDFLMYARSGEAP